MAFFVCLRDTCENVSDINTEAISVVGDINYACASSGSALSRDRERAPSTNKSTRSKVIGIIILSL